MTHKTRNSPSSPTKHRRQHNYYYPTDDEDDVNSNSPSRSPLESIGGDELEQQENQNFDFRSESMSNGPVSSAPAVSNFNLVEATSYVNIAPLPVFHGGPDECPATHLSRFAKVCRANNASSVEMMMRIFPVTLEGEAGLWYDLNIEPYPSISWEEIKASFLQAYRKTQITEQLKDELLMINQGNQECVRSYFLRLQRILQRWPENGIPEDLVKEIFVDGLREDFQDWVISQKPDSLGEALRLAFGYEQVESINFSRKKDVECGFCGGKTHREKDCGVRERMRALWRSKKSTEDNSEKQLTNNSVKNDGGEGEGEEAEVILSSAGKMKKKCQCWKKQFDRSNSLASRFFNAF